MKIAIPTEDNIVNEHFGHCDSYTIFSVNEMGRILNSEVFPAPEGCGCKSEIAGILQEKGVKVLLAGNMGPGAYTKLSNAGIRVYRGCSGDVNLLAESYIQGLIADNGEDCHHNHIHGDEHTCSH